MAKRTTRRRTRRQPRQTGAVAAAEPALAKALRAVCGALAELQIRYALVGGLAVSARAEPRLTRDVDLAVDIVDDAAAEALVHALGGRGYTVRATVEQTGRSRLATVRLEPPDGGGLVVDLLFASCGIEAEIVGAAEQLEILPDLIVPVATTSHLIAMKLLARDDRDRPQDLDDLRSLVLVLGKREHRDVITAIEQIAKRGYARGRDLVAAWKTVSKSR